MDLFTPRVGDSSSPGVTGSKASDVPRRFFGNVAAGFGLRVQQDVTRRAPPG
jgi:hypothetical protein